MHRQAYDRRQNPPLPLLRSFPRQTNGLDAVVPQQNREERNGLDLRELFPEAIARALREEQRVVLRERARRGGVLIVEGAALGPALRVEGFGGGKELGGASVADHVEDDHSPFLDRDYVHLSRRSHPLELELRVLGGDPKRSVCGG